MAGYGGFQQGPARLIVDENGNQQVVFDDFEVSPNNEHENIFKTYARTQGQVMDPRKSMLPYLLLYASGVGAPAAAGMQGANAAGGAGYTSGAALGSNAGYMSPALASGATNTAAGGLGSATFGGAATGMSGVGTGTLAGGVAPTAFGVGATAGVPAAMTAGGTASAIPSTIGNANFGTSLPGNATPVSNPYTLPRTDVPGTQPHNTGLTRMEASGNSQLPSSVTRDLTTNYGNPYPWQSGMQNTPWYQTAGKAAALKGAEAAPSLIMSAFMGGPARKQAAANLEATKTATLTAQQRNAYREWMRPMVEQAMRAMIQRLPTHLQGNLPQNFPTLRYPTGA